MVNNYTAAFGVNSCPLSESCEVFITVNYTHSTTKDVFFDNMAKITLISL
jgi:hypothetical protein